MASRASWTADDARSLSASLYPLADQIPDMCEELEQAGLATAARTYREWHRDLAGNDEAYAQIRDYWIEEAKERLAGLIGPMDILRGVLPPLSAYRSPLLDRLRVDAKAGKLRNNGPIVSPQIQPTIKRYVELMPDSPLAKAQNHALQEERRRAAKELDVAPISGFVELNESKRYELVLQRYARTLEPAGFAVDSTKKHGAVFRKLTADGRFAFLFVDTSRAGIADGKLDAKCALTHPRKAVPPSALPVSCVATIPLDCLVPGFYAALTFDRGSYSEMCLACDSACLLATIALRRINALLSKQ